MTASGISMTAESQVAPETPIVAAWATNVAAYDSEKNESRVARTVLGGAPAKQQINQHRRPCHANERRGESRNSPRGDITTGPHHQERPQPAVTAVQECHQGSECQNRRPGHPSHDHRIRKAEGKKAERQSGEAAEYEAQQQAGSNRAPHPRKHDERQCCRDDDDELDCLRRIGEQQKERCG
jgi:hypothetical protein